MKTAINKQGQTVLTLEPTEARDLRLVLLEACSTTAKEVIGAPSQQFAQNAYWKLATVLEVPTVEVKPEYFTKKQIEAGEGHLCVLGCGRRLRTLARSLKHGDVEAKDGGHTPAAGFTA